MTLWTVREVANERRREEPEAVDLRNRSALEWVFGMWASGVDDTGEPVLQEKNFQAPAPALLRDLEEAPERVPRGVADKRRTRARAMSFAAAACFRSHERERLHIKLRLSLQAVVSQRKMEATCH